MPGPAKTPARLKLIKGTFAKSRAGVAAPSFPVLYALPSAPIWLRKNVHAMREWKRLGPILVDNKLLDEGKITSFAQLCALGGYIAARFARGEVPTAAHVAQHRALCGALGLLAMNLSTPTPTNPFARHAPR
jgi:hypothetical protein